MSEFKLSGPDVLALVQSSARAGDGDADRSSASLFRDEVFSRFQASFWQPPLLSRPVSGLLLSSFAAIAAAGLVAFAVSFSFARKEQATGHLVPVAGWSRVSARSFAVVRRRHVETGDRVETGDVLYEFASGAGLRRGMSVERKLLQDVEGRRDALNARLAAIDAQFDNDRDLQEKERAAGVQQLQYLESEIASLEARLDISMRQHRDGLKLKMSGALADADLLDLADRAESRSALLAVAQRELVQIRSGHEMRQQQYARLALDREESRAIVVEQLYALAMEEAHVRDSTHVLAPRSGRVASVRVGVGDWVRPGDALLDILPIDIGLKARLFVRSSAIGLLDIGQEVRVYLDAFPYERHGAHAGRVFHVSETTLGPGAQGDTDRATGEFFRIEVEFPDGFNLSPAQRRSLRPGMTVSADLVRDYGTLLDWLLEPLRGAASRL